MNAKLYLLAAFVLCVVVGLVSPVFADLNLGKEDIRFYGVISQDGSPWEDCSVEIEKYNDGDWDSLGTNNTNESGYYNIPSTGYICFEGKTKEDYYKLYIHGVKVAEETINDGWVKEGEYDDNGVLHTNYSHDWNYDSNQIPEFTTISIPVVAILGLMFFFSYRKRRN